MPESDGVCMELSVASVGDDLCQPRVAVVSIDDSCLPWGTSRRRCRSQEGSRVLPGAREGGGGGGGAVSGGTKEEGEVW